VLVHNNSADARALGRALEAAGEVRATGDQAAHVVPTGAFSGRSASVQKAVRTAQAALESGGIPKNSAPNGFFAPAGHTGTHTDAYLLRLGEMMADAVSSDTVRETLNAIRLSLK
jgi:hypothetical protein